MVWEIWNFDKEISLSKFRISQTKFEEFQTVLASNVLPRLLKLAQEVKNLETIGLMPEDKMAELKALSDLVSNYFTISDREAIQNIGIVFYEGNG